MSGLSWLFMLLLVPYASGAHADESFLISCDGAPKEARLELPAPAKEWGKIACTKGGQILTAQQGWFWGFSAEPRPTFIPADILNSSKIRDVGNTVYFKEFKLRRLKGAEAHQRHELFHKWIGKDRTSIYPEVWELVATNESGKSLTLNVFKRPAEGGWGIACMPECGIMEPFLIVKEKD